MLQAPRRIRKRRTPWPAILAIGAAAVCILAVIFAVLFGAARADTTLGQWCDDMIPAMPQYDRSLTILVDSAGRQWLDERFSDGSSKRSALQQTGSTYRAVDSDHGDRYTIMADGSLELADDEGPIRVVSPLKVAQEGGRCHSGPLREPR